MAVIGRCLLITLAEEEDSFSFPPDVHADEFCLLQCSKYLAPPPGWTQMAGGMFWRRLDVNDHGQFVQMVRS